MAFDFHPVSHRHLLMIQLPSQFVACIHLVAPDILSCSSAAGSEGDKWNIVAIHHGRHSHTSIGVTSKFQGDIGSLSVQAPSSCFIACNGAIAVEHYVSGCILLIVGIVHVVGMHQQLVPTSHLLCTEEGFGGNVGVGHLLAIVLKGRGHQPSVFIDKDLMGAHLVEIGVVIELGVIHQIGAVVGCCDDAVMPLCALSLCHSAPMVVCPHQFLSSLVAIDAIVHHISVEDGAHPS